MNENICQQCKKSAEGASNRLVQDSCGHKKCRVCLLQDEDFCKQCSDEAGKKENTVIKYENKYAAVITCNGINKDINSDTADSNCTKSESEKPISQPVINKPKKPNKSQNESKPVGKQKRAYNAINIPTHITVTGEPNVYHCTICNKSFSTKAHVKYHSYCAGIRSHSCKICKKEFILKTQLDIHMYIHEKNKPHVCIQCGKSFGEKSKLKRHMILHSNLKTLTCSECGKSFKTKESLKVHSIIHRPDKPYSCKMCEAKFNNSSNLKKHLASHSDEKSHMCDQCGRTYKLKWALSVHQRSHSRVRQYECTVCNKTFVNHKDLQRHSANHLETKPFDCTYCACKFRRKDNLKRHVRNAHPGSHELRKLTVSAKRVVADVLSPPKPPSVVDNPNAIHVITASPAYASSSRISPKEAVAAPSTSTKPNLINGLPKLAFKTPEFKSSYNIQRNFKFSSAKSYDMAESVDICQKILSPHVSSPRNVIQKTSEPSSEICQRILDPSPPQNDQYQYRRPVIKQIKFKVPVQYTLNDRLESHYDPYKELAPQEPVKMMIPKSDKINNNSYTELLPAPTSVIVNHQANNMPWRKRTSEILNVKN
ncbi:zinc finger protein ZFP2 isoform X2 [Aethina tumida]|uniref:zinc finger protein ZFP2 isoform X2 n=1 Tax=Aethina tumida TaxID=116153 RepID=UPI0021477A6F|nr:zinc finger protein ZFP2 isoform X2 [Aethina tumida]